MNDDEQVQPASGVIPVAVDTNGHPWMATHHVTQLLRAIANSCRNATDDPDISPEEIAAAIDIEADAIEVRAIAATTGEAA